MSPATWIRGRMAAGEHRGHGKYLARICGILLGLAVAVGFYARALGGRLEEAGAAARERAPDAGARELGLAALIAVRYGLDVAPRAVAWVGAHDDLGLASALDPATNVRAVFAASFGPDTARDIFVADVALAGGVPVRAAFLRNLTQSPAADEEKVVASGDLVGFVRRVDGEPPTVVLLDTAGQDPALTASWPAVERLKDAVTNFQETGRLAGIHRVEVKLAAVPRDLELTWERDERPVVAMRIGDRRFVLKLAAGKALRIDTGDGQVVVTPRGDVRSGTALVASVKRMERTPRAHTAWAVDTMRAWVGPGPIEALEYLAFKFTDRYRRATVDADEAAQRIAESLPDTPAPGLAATYRFALGDDLGDVDLGWPPPDLPVLEGMPDRMRGEGAWAPVVDEEFVVNEPGAPPTFATTFLRTDPERPYSVVYMAAWDPRRVTLHPSGGSIEPKAATGETSAGMVPREDAAIRRFVAGFNGGFQALHGEFGLMQDGTLYLPPKAWGGMIFLLRGGRAAVGTWPGPGEDAALFDGGAACHQVPDGVDERALEEYFAGQGVISFRQNLTPLFGHGAVNPYNRTWWGSSPKDLEDPNPVTVRSSICWTQHGHVVYFYGLSTNLDAIVAGMEAAACRYGLHLDMNGGNVGWEFYRIVDAGAPPPPDMRAGFAAEGEVPQRPDLRFRARGLFQGMDIFRFPRYVQREPRDFFYLLLERNLPPADVRFEPAAEGDGVWSQRGLPVRSYPPPITFTSGPAGGGESRVYLVAVDPRWTSVRRGLGDDPAGALAAFAPVPGSAAVWQGEGAAPFAADDAVVALAADPLGLENLFLVDRWGDAGRRIGAWPVVLAVRGIPLSEASTGAFAGAFGDLPGERFLLYAEAGSGDGPTLYRALRAAGAERILGVSRDDGVGWAFLYEAEAPASGAAGGAVPGAIERRPLTQAAMLEAPLGDAAVFSLSATPPVLEVLRATEVVPPGVWNLPHTRRIRYFRTDDQRQGALRSY